jgi:hypothetical protein
LDGEVVTWDTVNEQFSAFGANRSAALAMRKARAKERGEDDDDIPDTKAAEEADETKQLCCKHNITRSIALFCAISVVYSPCRLTLARVIWLITVVVFDILYMDETPLIDMSLEERRSNPLLFLPVHPPPVPLRPTRGAELLRQAVKSVPYKFEIVNQVTTATTTAAVMEFLDKALEDQ